MKTPSKLWKLLVLTPLIPLLTGCLAAIALIPAIMQAPGIVGAFKNGAVSIELNETELKQTTSQKFAEKLQKLAIWPTSNPQTAAVMGAPDVSMAESLIPALSDMKVMMLSPSQTTRELKKLNIDSGIEGKTSEDVIADIETLCKAAELDLVVVPRWIVSFGNANTKDIGLRAITLGFVAAKSVSKTDLLFYGCRSKTQSTVTGQVSVEQGMRTPAQSEVAQSVGVALSEAVASILAGVKSK
jgi:hypothetical protein